MKDLTALKAKAAQARASHAYRAEGASLRFTEDLVAFMKTSGLTRTALAEKIGSSPAYVTKILRGETNFTLDSMVKIATALGCELTIGLQSLQPKDSTISLPFHATTRRARQPTNLSNQSTTEIMATNPPTGDSARRGQVTGRSQTLNPTNGHWTKHDTGTGRFLDQKADGKPFKGVRKER